VSRHPGIGLALRGLAGALAGLGLAGALGALAADQRQRDLVAYTLGTLPLAAGLAAFARRPERGWAPGGALLSIAAAALTAWVLAAIRFRLGSEGIVSLQALPFTREGLIVVGLLPALALAGASVARRRGGLPASVGAGVLVTLVSGPMLLVSAGLGALPALDPIVVTILVLVGAGSWAGRVRDPGSKV
jgi:hypothetical protein